MREFRHIELSGTDLKDPVTVMGLPGIGNVGRIAIQAMIESLGAIHVMDFYSDDFPARVTVHDGITSFPKSSIYLYRAAPDEPHDILLLTADYQPASGKGVFEYADYVVEEFKSLKVKEIYALAAYEQGYSEFFKTYPGPPRIFVSASSSDLLGRIASIEGTIPTREGVITGANGFIPAWAATRHNLDGACFLGETLGIIKLDYRASREVMQKVASFLGLKSKFDILDDRVNQVIEFIEWAMNEIEHRASQGENTDSAPDRYIG
ncbi:MAG: PAC2 family protein [Candidatus Thorarchaeota archaeon]|nr:PAC2 family protein [Candidatus Thorarchaeota archaeon]